MDKIIIKDLEIFANHGVMPEENALGQKFLVSAVMQCDTRAAGMSDDITRSVNYADVCKLISSEMQKNTFKLIEAAAERIAEAVLLKYKTVREITVTVKKPWAPIAMSADTVAVEITRGRHTAFIALGSNIDDKRAHLNGAVGEIAANKRCALKKVSDFIVTEPVGGVEQDDFLNGCIEIETLLTPHELLDFLHEIENAHGRERTVHWGPRTLDLDIIMYDDLIMSDETLTIPHIEMTNRRFVLEPLVQIAPYAVHPIEKKTISALLKALG